MPQAWFLSAPSRWCEAHRFGWQCLWKVDLSETRPSIFGCCSSISSSWRNTPFSPNLWRGWWLSCLNSVDTTVFPLCSFSFLTDVIQFKCFPPLIQLWYCQVVAFCHWSLTPNLFCGVNNGVGQSASAEKNSPCKFCSYYVRGISYNVHQSLIKCLLIHVFSGILSALGNFLSQTLEARKKAKQGLPCNEIDIAGAARYAVYGWDFNLCSWFIWKKIKSTLFPKQPWLIFCINDGAKHKHNVFVQTYIYLNLYLSVKCCCVLQAFDHRASEPLLLSAHGAVDTQQRPVLHSQTSSPGQTCLCSWLSAPLFLCDEHSRGEFLQICYLNS